MVGAFPHVDGDVRLECAYILWSAGKGVGVGLTSSVIADGTFR